MAIVDEASGSLVDTVVAGGTTVSTASYRMVTLNFLAGGGDGYPFPDLADPAVDAKSLVDEPGNLPPGVAEFADPGSEQDALAEYLAANFPQDAPFDQAETPRSEDQRIVFLTQP
jgi:2',3'-cyclic-nucleotide 2'-phosphodiesterase (5'-nucleotidase family)